jgi:hypothetical protein
MAHWGVAYAAGPNYNKAWDAFDPADLAASLAKAFTAAQRALECAGRRATPAEQALVTAIAARYPAPAPPVDAAAWSEGYARAMRRAHLDHPEDLDIAALFADALMNVTPWRLWDLPSGGPAPGAHTPEAMRVLELALERPAGMAHPGVLHMYIHLMEMSPHPERALRAADSLRALVPDGGHLLHMPTHIDVLCGDYRRVVASNSDAIAADQRFLAREGPMNFYTLYRAHNYHFKIYGAMFAGQQQAALEAADGLRAALPEELLRVATPPMADWLEGFVPMKLHALIRFGRWPDIIATAPPGDQALYCVTTAMTHYAKGVALAATGDLGGAGEQRRLFRAAAVPGRPRAGRHPATGLPSPGERVGAARLPRVPGPAGQARAGPHHREAARAGGGRGRRAGHRLLRLPPGRAGRVAPLGAGPPPVQRATSRCIRSPGPNRVCTSWSATKPAFS